MLFSICNFSQFWQEHLRLKSTMDVVFVPSNGRAFVAVTLVLKWLRNVHEFDCWKRQRHVNGLMIHFRSTKPKWRVLAPIPLKRHLNRLPTVVSKILIANHNCAKLNIRLFSAGIRSKLRKVFPFNFSLKDKLSKNTDKADLANYISGAQPLPGQNDPKAVKSLIRPLEVPK